MKKILLKLAALEAAFLLVLVPIVAYAQSYPAPTFGSLILQNPLTPANGGTGATTSTGTGSAVLSNSPALTTPNLGTPSAATLTHATGLPVSTGISGLGTGVATGLANAVTGSGSPVLATSPSIASPTVTGAFTATGLVTTADLATQAANTVLANVTGSTASPAAFAMPSCSGANNALRWTSGTGFSCAASIALTSGTLAQFAATTSAQLAGIVADETGSGSLVFGTSPTIGTPTITGGSINNATVGATTPSTGSFTTLAANSTATFSGSVGVGVTPAVPFDAETSGAVGNPSANGTLARFYAGSSGSPITAITPTVGISRYESINQDTEGGQNAALYTQVVGNNTSTPGSIVAQVNGITSDVTQNGSGDAVGFFTYAKNNSTTQGTAFGGFFDAIANTSATYAYAIETFSTNNTGANAPLTIGSQPKIVGLHITPNGSYNATSALWVSSNTNSGGNVWDSGLYLSPSSVGTYGFVDASGSAQSLTVQGTHGYGLVLNTGTFTGAQIQATGWQLGANGTVLTSISPTSNWNVNSAGSTVSIANGSNAAFTAGNGLIVVEESANSNSAVYLCSVGQCTLIGANGSVWVASTTSPAAGKMSVAYSGSAYAIYNNQGTTETVAVNSTKMKATN
jgi:hypothetical protein